MIDQVLQILNKIDFVEYKNSWKSIQLISTNTALNFILSDPDINLSQLYITDISIPVIQSQRSIKYNISIIDEKYLIDQVEYDKPIDFNLIYILHVSGSHFKVIHDQLIKNYNSKTKVRKVDNELKRYQDLSDTTSRYSICDRIVYENEELVESMDRIIIPKSVNDIFHEVTARDENRLDLISYQYYGTPRYWWIIAYASNVYDPLSLPIGTILRIPPRDVALSILREENN